MEHTPFSFARKIKTYVTLLAVLSFSTTSEVAVLAFFPFPRGGETFKEFSPPPSMGPTRALVRLLESGLLLGVANSDLVMSSELLPNIKLRSAADSPGDLSSGKRNLLLLSRLLLWWCGCGVGWWW